MKQFFLLLGLGLLFLSSCEKKELNPKITTLQAVPTSASSCNAKAQVDEMGSYALIDHGFVYFFGSSDNLNYVNAQNKISLGKQLATDTFSATLPLSSGSYYYSGYKWYVWAYITNEKGTVYGKAVSFDPLVLSLQSISPTTAKTGDTITIYGSHFDPAPQNNTVQFYNSSYITARVVTASKTALKVIVPDFSGSSYYYYDNYYDIVVTVGGQTYSLNNVFSPAFSVTSFSPNVGTFGTTIYIYGSNFSQISGILFGNTLVTSYSTYTNYISVSVPYNLTSKKFKLYIVKGGTSTEVPGGEFVMNQLTATSFSPATVYPGSSITITGNNFNSSYSYNKVFFGTVGVTPSYSSYSSTSLTVYLPTGLIAGNYTLSVSNGLDTVAVPGTLKVVVPTITGISPSSGYWGTDLTISGHNLNTSYSYVYLNGSTYYAYSYDSASFKIKVPNYITPGTYKIALYTGYVQVQSPTDFTLLSPTLTSITPSTGSAGTAVIITGEGFGTSTGNVSVKFGSLSATVSAVSNTQINAIVPSGAGKGAWMVSVTVNGYTISNSLSFSVP
jgi:hypothetical protein